MKLPLLPPLAGLCALGVVALPPGPHHPEGKVRRASVGPQPAVVRIHAGSPDARILWRGVSPFEATGARGHWQGVEPGKAAVDFPPLADLGQRGSHLEFDVPAGSDVDLHVDYGARNNTSAAAPASGTLWDTNFDRGLAGWDVGSEASWFLEDGRLYHTPTVVAGPATTEWHTTLVGASPRNDPQQQWSNYLFAVDCGFDATTRGGFGIVFRHTGFDNWYRLIVDPANQTLVLSRSVGGQQFTIRSTPLPPEASPTGTARLAVQVDGFGIDVFLDHVLVMQEMDGAHDLGRMGLCAQPGTGVSFDNALATRPVRPVATHVAIRTPGRLSVHGVRPDDVGKEYWLGMTSPGLPVIRLLDQDGIPPFAVVQTDTSWFGVGRYVHRYTRGMRGVVGNDGHFRARIEWPDLPALRHQHVGITGWTVDAEGGARRW